MATPLNTRGGRGESFIEGARRKGIVNGVTIAPDATDQEVLDATATSISAEAVAASNFAGATVAAIPALLDTISDESLVVIADRPVTGGFAPGTFTKWEVAFESGSGLDVADGALVTRFSDVFSYETGTVATKRQLWSRDKSDPDTGHIVGNAASDTLIAEYTQTLASAGVTAGGAPGRIFWPITLQTDPAKSYIIVSTADAGAKKLAPQTNDTATGYSDIRRGWYHIGAGANVLSPGTAVALRLETTKRTVRGADTVAKRTATRLIPGEQTNFVFDNSTAKTFRAIMALARGFDAVRVIFNNGGSGSYNVAKCAVGAVATPSNYACAGVTWVPVLFDGLSGAAVPASPGATRTGWLASDWIDIASLERSDDAQKCPLLAIAAYIDTASLKIMGFADGSQDYTGMASDPDRPFVFRYNNGDCVTTPASFSSTTNRSASPIVGVQYRAKGEVKTVWNLGDSISAPPNGWGFQSCVDKSNRAIAFEHGSVAWAGSGSNTFDLRFTDVVDALGIKPDAAFVPVWTPNNSTGVLTDAAIDDMRTWAKRAVYAVQRYGTIAIPWTGIPTNPAVHDYGATDVKRRNYNAEWRALAGLGVTVADMEAAMTGTRDGDGQDSILSGKTSDDIHPNAAGNVTMKGRAVPALSACGLFTAGALT